MLMNGTVISETRTEAPQLSTARNIATRIIAQVASNQYGGLEHQPGNIWLLL